MQSEALHTVVHVLRSPLTTMVGFTELLLRRPPLGVDQRQQFLSHIHRKTRLMAHLVADLQHIAGTPEQLPV